MAQGSSVLEGFQLGRQSSPASAMGDAIRNVLARYNKTTEQAQTYGFKKAAGDVLSSYFGRDGIQPSGIPTLPTPEPEIVTIDNKKFIKTKVPKKIGNTIVYEEKYQEARKEDIKGRILDTFDKATIDVSGGGTGGGTVSVIDPNGVPGTIPAEDLKQALKEGYRRA